VVDPDVGTSRRALALAARGHRFVGPDNGLLTPVLDGADIVSLPIPGTAAPTFHGRDVFAPAAAALASGTALQELGRPVPDPFRLPLPEPELRGGDVHGTVTYIDRFGTLVTNVPGALVPAHAVIWLGDRAIGPIRRTFSDVPPHALVALIGSGGRLEVARRDGSAAGLLRAEVGSPERIAVTG
jgi:S-adenosylmethionine hydrolase